jgi:hypothetical protein
MKLSVFPIAGRSVTDYMFCGCYAVSIGKYLPTFRGMVLLFLINPEDEGTTIIRNVGT